MESTKNIVGVLISIISLLADPNCSSPANVDAGVRVDQDYICYRKVIDIVTLLGRISEESTAI